jgi:hypothetical protein
MEARQAQAADWEALRQLRLRALADAPDAFASTLEAEVAFPDEVWWQRAQGGPASATFIAREGGVDVGLVRVFAEPEVPGRMHLVSMWVDPGLPAAGGGPSPGRSGRGLGGRTPSPRGEPVGG